MLLLSCSILELLNCGFLNSETKISTYSFLVGVIDMKKAKILQQCQFESMRYYSHDTFGIKDKKKLYSVLGLDSSATQAEIKSAYYKLSMTYHPDKSKDSEEAKIKFQEISEAYEVLGNYELRKKYDRGIFRPMKTETSFTETEATDEHSGFYKSREVRTRQPPPSGRTQIYNFDEFYRMHYGDTIKREVRSRKKYKEFTQDTKENKLSAFQAVVFLVIFSGIVIFVDSLLSSSDKPTQTTNQK